jgi:GntR family transcriptional regulator, transcriptional repressor for pyruvate dehydrogenase complex
MMDISPVKKTSISEEITEQLLRLILRGKLEPGEKLTPERDLAASFNTNRNTLREAIRNLETLNLVEARQGDGLRVRDFRMTGELNLLPYYLREAQDREELFRVLDDVLGVRRLLFEGVCQILTARASRDQLEQIRGMVLAQRNNEGDPGAMFLADLAISEAMVTASQSMASRWMFNTFAKIYGEIVSQFPVLWVFTDDYVEARTAVLDAAMAGNGEKARELMRAHLERTDKMVMAVVSEFAATMSQA